MVDRCRGRRPQGEAGDFRCAAVADRLLATNPLTDIEQRVRSLEEPSVEVAAVAAGHQDWTKPGQANLAAMVMTGDHQLDSA